MIIIVTILRDLESFNARYPDDIPQQTYAWYQAMFHQRAADVHKVSGLKFLTMLRTSVPSEKKVK